MRRGPVRSQKTSSSRIHSGATVNRCRALLVIDNAPLHAAAWQEFIKVRKRLEKITLDIHRHEEVDEPMFRQWISTAFPTLLSELRDLAQEMMAKSRLASEIESAAFLSGRSPEDVWAEWRANGGRPLEPEEKSGDDDCDPEAGGEEGDGNGFDDDPPGDGDLFDELDDFLGLPRRARTPRDDTSARDIYRRLVLQLHPDRGGEWTPERQRAWLQVQQAWAARDADWLARLEVEWESASQQLGLGSTVSRLRAAIAEALRACRDAQKRTKDYKHQPSWRFSLKKMTPGLKETIESRLRADLFHARFELKQLEQMFAHWERPLGMRRAKRNRGPE